MNKLVVSKFSEKTVYESDLTVFKEALKGIFEICKEVRYKLILHFWRELYIEVIFFDYVVKVAAERYTQAFTDRLIQIGRHFYLQVRIL